MEAQRRKEADFTEGPILGKLIRFMLPVLAALMIQSLYSAVDLLIVGHFATTASVAGVSMGGQIVAFMTFIIAGIATAMTVLIGQFLGEKRLNDAGNVVGTGILFFAALTVIITAVLLIFARPMLTLMNLPEEAMGEGVIYTRICAAGYLFVTAYNVFGCIFRGIGDSKTPLITVVIASIINVAGDLLLVGVFRMAAAGAAIATIFAQALSVALSLIIAKTRGLPFTFSRANIRLQWMLMWRIIKLGFPLAVNEIAVGASFIVLSAILNTLGLVESAAVGVTTKLTSFIMVFTGAFLQSLAAFCAQNVGARKLPRAKKALGCGIAVSVAFAAIMFYFAWPHGTWLTGIFTGDEAVVLAAAVFLKSYAIDTFLTAPLFCMVGYFNGCGRTGISLAQGLIGVAVRIPAAFMLRTVPGATMFTIGLATPISTVVQIVFCVICYLAIDRRLRQAYDDTFTG